MTTARIEIPRAFRPLLGPARYKGAYGGRGGAKSWFFANLLILKCLQKPTRWVCIREVQKSLEQSVKRLLEDRIQALGVGSQFRVLNTHIETPGDGRIIFQGMQNHTAETIKSLEGYNGAWVEEAQALSRRSLDLLRPTIMRNEGAELWFSWNPKSPSDPVDELLRSESTPPKSIVVKTGWEDNPWLSDELRDEIEWDRTRDPAKFAHVWGGEYLVRSDAQVFKNWRIEEFETPSDVRFFYGADWGFSIDPATMVRSWIEGRKLYIDYEAYKVGCPTDYLPFLFGGTQDLELQKLNAAAWESLPVELRQWRGVPGARQWPCVADSARPETIDYLKRHGFPRMEPARKGAGSVEEGVEWLQSYDIVVHPRCQHTADELTLYSYKVDPRTEQVLPVLKDERNHIIDPLRYATEALRKKPKISSAVWGRRR